MDYIKFSNDKLNLEDITNLVTASSCGAISLFVGMTRDNFDGKEVINLEYEAYESMGIKAMQNICLEIRKQWEQVENIAIYHRLGQVPVKEASIVIAISSPHREAAIKATEYCINSVKSSVPIWKKEVYSDAKSAWKENKESSTYPPKRKKITLAINQKIDAPFVPSHLVQIKANNEEVKNRISKCMERKRTEIDSRNITEFFPTDRDPECGCARTDSVMNKRKDSKSHLEVKRIFNNYQNRDQKSSHYLTKYIPANGIEERLQNLECQLSLGRPAPKNVYKRLQMLEDRLMILESISPEYIQFWDKTSLPHTKSVKKKILSLEEIDDLIAEVEKKGVYSSRNG